MSDTAKIKYRCSNKSCLTALSALYSEIGSSKCCPSCGADSEVPLPTVSLKMGRKKPGTIRDSSPKPVSGGETRTVESKPSQEKSHQPPTGSGNETGNAKTSSRNRVDKTGSKADPNRKHVLAGATFLLLGASSYFGTSYLTTLDLGTVSKQDSIEPEAGAVESIVIENHLDLILRRMEAAERTTGEIVSLSLTRQDALDVGMEDDVRRIDRRIEQLKRDISGDLEFASSAFTALADQMKLNPEKVSETITQEEIKARQSAKLVATSRIAGINSILAQSQPMSDSNMQGFVDFWNNELKTD